MRPPLILFAVAALPACYPVLAHPTRVEEGIRWAYTGSVGLVRDSAVDATAPNGIVHPSLDIEVSLHIRDTLRPSSTALRLAGEFGLGGLGGSLYAELPRDWFSDVDAGVGYHGRYGYLKSHSVYVQLGAGTSSAWFIRNGMTWMTGKHSPGRIVWVPVIGRTRASGEKHLTWYAGGIVGAQVPVAYPCQDFTCSDHPTGYKRTYLVIGLSVDGVMVR